ncbi:hypothetical protein CARUB_v10016947mg [Capsella rubella]|uniref:Mitochondrial import inner membrane translocase subunit TIM50 n=1 Tax=Capsella rubella TaxID=81985 RepID=R0HF75_9BRAS|nr:uncharacterized protein LOC17885052 [Capsella rubella]EOA23735.1 hypothetical protein CARUB_v10016947mg [Capsella rubella]
MRAIERSDEEELVIKKKARMVSSNVENSYEVPMLLQNETVVEENKETNVVMGDDESCKNGEETECTKRKIDEVSVLSLVDLIGVVENGENVGKVKALEVGKSEEVPMLSGNEVNVVQVPLVGDIEEEEETCVASGGETESNERKIEEGSVLSVGDRIGVVENGENIEKVKALEVEKSYVVPMLSGNEVNVVQVPLVGDIEEEKETCVASGGETESNERKIEEGSVLSVGDRIGVVENGENVGKVTALEVGKSGEVPGVEKVSVFSLAGRKHDVENGGNIGNVPVLEVEKSDEASLVAAIARSSEVPGGENRGFCVDSGGIREVTGSYSMVLRKKLLVLDLNGLLADVVNPLKDVKADINIGRRAIFKRPFCEEFLKFCFDKFEVGIWSSRKQNNVVRITEYLLGDMMKKLLFCWDMSYCATTTIGSLENKHKFVVFKDLNRLWEKHDPNLPWRMGDYNETNTVLLDDSPYKALLNPPYTAIFPHSYNHQNKTDTSLGTNGDLRLHLQRLVDAENVQEFIKNNPFGQEAITEASESWDFYREAIRMLHVPAQIHRFRNLIR